MSAEKKPRRLGLIIPWVAALLVVVGYFFYWNTLRSEAITRIDAWMESERMSGVVASYGSVKADGFPFRLSLRYENLVYSPADRGWRLEFPFASVHVNPANISHVIAAPNATFIFTNREGQRYEVSSAMMETSLRLDGAKLARASLEAKGVNATPLAPPPGAQPATATAAVVLEAHVRPSETQAGVYQVALRGMDITLPTPPPALAGLGDKASLFEAAISVEQGDLLANAPKSDPLGPWADAGGQARVEAMALQWGAAKLKASGDITVDAQRRLAGRLGLDLEEPGAAFSALAASPTLSQDAKTALTLIAIGANAKGGPLQTPLQARDGALVLADVVPVMALKPLYPRQ
jgi:hypothetical protein